jgi:2',3'-cyclic-nucleotide 2'-phosphodiesterase (5'-nucleotidase family)
VRSLASDTLYSGWLSVYRNEMNQRFEREIGVLPFPLHRNGPPDSLGQRLIWNHLTDAALAFARDSLSWQADVCLLNSGGIRADLGSGSVKLRSIYEALPFDNALVLVELDSLKWLQMRAYLLQNTQPQSGMVYVIESGRIADVERPGKTWPLRVLTVDYLAGGGDRMEFFAEAATRSSGVMIRDAYLWYWEEHPERLPAFDGRSRIGGTPETEKTGNR